MAFFSQQTETTIVPRRIAWLRVFAIVLAAFIFNTTEFVPIGLLTAISDSFAMQPAQTGIMLTIYAWLVALLSLPLVLLSSRLERRGLLVGLFLLFIASHVLSVLAWSFPILVLSRIGIAFAHAVFWSINAAVVLRLAPAGKKAQALSLLATGTSLAMVLGLPLGRIIGEWLGWRMTFLIIAVVASVILLVIIRLLPRLPSQQSGSLTQVWQLLKNKALVALYLLLVIMVTGHYTVYSYVEPFVINSLHLSAQFATMILLLFGASGILGSLLFGRFNQHTTLLTLLSLASLALCLALLLPLGHYAPLMFLLSILWGMAVMLIALGVQIKVLALAGNATDIAMSFFSGIFNIGIGAGALVGNQISLHWHMSYIGLVGAALSVLALLWALWIFHRYPYDKQTVEQ